MTSRFHLDLSKVPSILNDDDSNVIIQVGEGKKYKRISPTFSRFTSLLSIFRKCFFVQLDYKKG